MIRALLTLSAALVCQPAFAQSVEVAEGDWSAIPVATSTGGPEWLTETAMNRIDRLVSAGKCPRAGSRARVDLQAPFLIQFDNRATVQRIVIQRLGCPEVESIVGSVIIGRAKQGFYRPTGANQTGWYRSEISYSAN